MDIQKCDHILKLCMLSIHYLILKQKMFKEKILLVLVFANKVTVDLFVIVPYLFSSSSSVELLAIRKLVAAVTNVKENDIEIEYGSAISKKKIKFIGKDKDLIQQIQF